MLNYSVAELRVNLYDNVRTCMRARVKGLHRAKKCLANIL